MATTAQVGDSSVPGPSPARSSRSQTLLGQVRLPQHWPLTVAFAGFPIWWALGLSVIVPFLCTGVMAAHLARRHRSGQLVLTPPYFGVYLLFLVWVGLGAFMLWADAPGAQPGGMGFARVLVFVYRAAWYVVAAVVLLWIANADERQVSSRRVHALMAWMFLVTVAGGYLGVLAPNVEFTSLVESLLPAGLRSDSLIREVVHPDAADVQSVLGYAEARPTAPFAYANSWGSCLALFLPFFVIGWSATATRWQRSLVPVGVLLAAGPAVASLNRGLWTVLLLAAVIAWVQLLVRGRYVAAAGLTLAGLAAVTAFVASPLYTTVVERLQHPHSNSRRAELLDLTTRSTAVRSPVVGYGSTRDVQGSFASIAGGDRPDCPACGVPPLGTQGQLWMVMFSQGFVGLALLLWFLVAWLSRTWRAASPEEAVATLTVTMLLAFLPIYDTLGLPLVVVTLAIGLAWRAQRGRLRRESSGSSLERVRDAVRAGAGTVLVLSSVAGLLGLAWGLTRPVQYEATSSVLLSDPPPALEDDALDQVDLPPEPTIDTEAALVLSERTLSRATASTRPEVNAALLRRVELSAPANTRVLDIAVRARTAEAARRESQALTQAYLATRRDFLAERRAQTSGILRETARGLDAATVLADEGDLVVRAAVDRAAAEASVAAIDPGTVIRDPTVDHLRRQVEIPVLSGIGIGLLLAVGTTVVRSQLGRGSQGPGAQRR